MVGRQRKLRTGSRTCGRGRKAGRGAGKRGGRGNAGTHKHKYISIVKYDPKHFGMHGFKRPQSVVSSNAVINVEDLLELSKRLAKGSEPDKKADRIYLDLAELGYDKLLGNGALQSPFHVRIAKASQQAIEKVQAAGGKIEII